MKILVIEDDEFKFRAIRKLVSSKYSGVNFVFANAISSGIKALMEDTYDCILLDIALPGRHTKKGEGTPISFLSGGTEILQELDYTERSEPVIIVTQFPEITFNRKAYALSKIQSVIDEELNVNLIGVVHFKRNETEWKESLVALLEKIL